MSRRQGNSDEENQWRSANGRDEHRGTDSLSQDMKKNSPIVRDPVFDRLVQGSHKELVFKSNGNTILNLATLQRMVMFRLQANIIEKAGPLIKRKFFDDQFGNKHPLDVLKDDLTAYAQAVRDWEFMAELQAKAGGELSRDPFCISSKGELVSEVMKNLDGNSGSYDNPTLETLTGSFRQRNRVNKERSLKGFLLRFFMALFGGVALVGPMLLMVLHNDITTSLSTTSVAIFLFAIIVARFSEAGPETIIGAVAAYAAVLVVFVGTSLS